MTQHKASTLDKTRTAISIELIIFVSFFLLVRSTFSTLYNYSFNSVVHKMKTTYLKKNPQHFRIKGLLVRCLDTKNLIQVTVF